MSVQTLYTLELSNCFDAYEEFKKLVILYNGLKKKDEMQNIKIFIDRIISDTYFVLVLEDDTYSFVDENKNIQTSITQFYEFEHFDFCRKLINANNTFNNKNIYEKKEEKNQEENTIIRFRFLQENSNNSHFNNIYTKINEYYTIYLSEKNNIISLLNLIKQYTNYINKVIINRAIIKNIHHLLTIENIDILIIYLKSLIKTEILCNEMCTFFKNVIKINRCIYYLFYIVVHKNINLFRLLNKVFNNNSFSNIYNSIIIKIPKKEVSDILSYINYTNTVVNLSNFKSTMLVDTLLKNNEGFTKIGQNTLISNDNKKFNKLFPYFIQKYNNIKLIDIVIDLQMEEINIRFLEYLFINFILIYDFKMEFINVNFLPVLYLPPQYNYQYYDYDKCIHFESFSGIKNVDQECNIFNQNSFNINNEKIDSVIIILSGKYSIIEQIPQNIFIGELDSGNENKITLEFNYFINYIITKNKQYQIVDVLILTYYFILHLSYKKEVLNVKRLFSYSYNLITRILDVLFRYIIKYLTISYNFGLNLLYYKTKFFYKIFYNIIALILNNDKLFYFIFYGKDNVYLLNMIALLDVNYDYSEQKNTSLFYLYITKKKFNQLPIYMNSLYYNYIYSLDIDIILKKSNKNGYFCDIMYFIKKYMIHKNFDNDDKINLLEMLLCSEKHNNTSIKIYKNENKNKKYLQLLENKKDIYNLIYEIYHSWYYNNENYIHIFLSKNTAATNNNFSGSSTSYSNYSNNNNNNNNIRL